MAAAFRQRLSGEHLIYLGDTARLPYGTKSPEMVVRYALRAAEHLAGQGVKMLVVACNTASAHALTALRRAWPHLPVLGVVEAGASAAAGHAGIVVIATEGTCRSGAFTRAIAARAPAARVTAVPAPLLVAVAEEGLTAGPIAEAAIRHTLGDAFAGAGNDCLLLGCTHFPLLAPALRAVIGPGPAMVDCADAVAEQAATLLADLGLAAPPGTGGLALAVTDAPDRFARIAARLFPSLGPDPVIEVVDL